jgi:hypothetical protein
MSRSVEIVKQRKGTDYTGSTGRADIQLLLRSTLPRLDHIDSQS